jgi:hypothetical protein
VCNVVVSSVLNKPFDSVSYELRCLLSSASIAPELTIRMYSTLDISLNERLLSKATT